MTLDVEVEVTFCVLLDLARPKLQIQCLPTLPQVCPSQSSLTWQESSSNEMNLNYDNPRVALGPLLDKGEDVLQLLRHRVWSLHLGEDLLQRLQPLVHLVHLGVVQGGHLVHVYCQGLKLQLPGNIDPALITI